MVVIMFFCAFFISFAIIIMDIFNKKYKKKYLKGRTIPGINSEISWHYRAYNLRIVVNHANPADLGSTDKKNSGYDSNAWIFEPKINWGDEKL